MKKFISLILTGTMLLSIPVMANTDYTSAIKQVKSAFTVPDYKTFEVSDNDDTLSLSWKDSKDKYVFARIKNGTIIIYSNYNEDNKNATKTLSKIELRKICDKNISKILGQDSANWKLEYINQYDKYTTEFTYKRYVGGYPVDGDLITINLNNSDGSIYNYTRELDKIPDITTPKNIISKTDAKDTYLKNSNFGLWYTDLSKKPVFAYLTTSVGDPKLTDGYNISDVIPCVDAETGEFFYGLANIHSLKAELGGSGGASNSGKFESSSKSNNDEFISAEDAVKVLNKKLGTTCKSKDFKLDHSYGDEKLKTAVFSKSDDNSYSSFSIDSNNNILYYFEDTKFGNSADASKFENTANEIIKKNGYNLPDFYSFNISKDTIRYYKKKNGIPCEPLYIDITFNKQGKVISYENGLDLNYTFINATPTIATDDAFDIASRTFDFTPEYIRDSNNPSNYRLAYYFKSTPFVDCDGNALAGTGEKYYKESQIYADVTDKEDRAVVLFLSKAGYNFDDLTKFEPDKALTLRNLLKYLNGGCSLLSINKSLHTDFAKKDIDTPLTVKQVIIILESLKYKTYNLPMLSSAFKNQDNDVYTNIALNIGAIKNAERLDNNATRMDLANYVYKIIYGQNK